MIILKGGYTPYYENIPCENIPVEIEVAYGIVSTLIERGLLKVRKNEIGYKQHYVWELKIECGDEK